MLIGLENNNVQWLRKVRAIRIKANNSNPVILREFDKFFKDVATIVIADK